MTIVEFDEWFCNVSDGFVTSAGWRMRIIDFPEYSDSFCVIFTGVNHVDFSD